MFIVWSSLLLLRVEEFVQLGAGRVVELDESRPFRRLFRPQEVQRFLDGAHLLLGASVTAVVGDDRDDSCEWWKKNLKSVNKTYYTHRDS